MGSTSVLERWYVSPLTEVCILQGTAALLYLHYGEGRTSRISRTPKAPSIATTKTTTATPGSEHAFLKE